MSNPCHDHNVHSQYATSVNAAQPTKIMHGPLTSVHLQDTNRNVNPYNFSVHSDTRASHRRASISSSYTHVDRASADEHPLVTATFRPPPDIPGPSFALRAASRDISPRSPVAAVPRIHESPSHWPATSAHPIMVLVPVLVESPPTPTTHLPHLDQLTIKDQVFNDAPLPFSGSAFDPDVPQYTFPPPPRIPVLALRTAGNPPPWRSSNTTAPSSSRASHSEENEEPISHMRSTLRNDSPQPLPEQKAQITVKVEEDEIEGMPAAHLWTVEDEDSDYIPEDESSDEEELLELPADSGSVPASEEVAIDHDAHSAQRQPSSAARTRRRPRCEPCGRSFNRALDLQRHLASVKVHNPDPQYPCPEDDCDKALTRYDALKRHLRDVHGITD
ncbi:hypothetical protein EW146_g1979 [Bondarzewia mesenterica]|uniref:C2H2-type domain-containing protein n=1 Tax=Bondarzewia mesenterica TaxID=1095465 RepID=A0A4S4M3M2_9AGAM|nr:hypothetical protein EW146_g1979 [Bondarzewia mesenterica]